MDSHTRITLAPVSDLESSRLRDDIIAKVTGALSEVDGLTPDDAYRVRRDLRKLLAERLPSWASKRGRT
jgi:hypothetical protein